MGRSLPGWTVSYSRPADPVRYPLGEGQCKRSVGSATYFDAGGSRSFVLNVTVPDRGVPAAEILCYFPERPTQEPERGGMELKAGARVTFGCDKMWFTVDRMGDEGNVMHFDVTIREM